MAAASRQGAHDGRGPGRGPARRGHRRHALLADLAAIARRLSADEWARQQQVETLEEGRGA
jgi:hypothetical protein